MAKDAYAVLALPDFRQLLLGRVLTTVATQVQSVAVGWQIYALTGDALSLGLIGLSEAFPAIGVALYAGHICDVTNRKVVYLSAVGLLTASFGALAWLTAAHLNHEFIVLAIYAMVFVGGFARGFMAPSMFGLISDLVPRELYANAAAWNTTLWQISAILGPIIAGVAYVKLGATNTFLFATILLFLGLIAVSLITKPKDPEPSKHTSIVESIKEGLHFVFTNQIVLGAMSLDLFAVLFGGAVALLPIFAGKIFHGGPAMLGELRAAPAVGSLIMAVFLAFNPVSKGAGKTLLTVVAGFGICMILFGLSTNYELSLFLLALSGAFDSVSVFVRNTTFQIVTPLNMKGRVAAVNSIFIGSSNEIGEFESGVMAKLMGTVPSVVLGGCMTLLVVAVTTLKAPKLRQLDLRKEIATE